MPEYNAEWPTFTDYCRRLLDDKKVNGVFPPFGRVGGLEPSMLDTLDACLRAIVYTTKNGGGVLMANMNQKGEGYLSLKSDYLGVFG